MKTLRAFLGIAAIVIGAQAFGATADIEIYAELLDYDVVFKQTGSDVVVHSRVITDTGLTSGKMKAELAFTVDGTYTTCSAELSKLLVFGDSDGNGIPDALDLDKSYSESFVGSGTYKYSDESSFFVNLSGSFYRSANQFSFKMDETGTVQSSTVDGINPGKTGTATLSDLIPIHAKGTIDYDPDSGTYNYSLYYFGTTGSANGSGTMTSENENRVTFSKMSFPSMGYAALSSSSPELAQQTLAGTLALDRVDSNTYQTQTTVQDIQYFIKLTDDNDADKDGIPDLSDPPQTEPPAVSLDGWNYHVWPWVYSDADKDWLYYAHTANGWAVWRNKDKKWYAFNASTSTWTAY